mgnify:CR=1 FL=1
MVTIQQILSEAQTSIGDLGNIRNMKAEMVDEMNYVIREVARETEIWIGRYIMIPNPLVRTWSATDTYDIGQLVTNGGSTWYCLATNTNSTPAENAIWTQVITFDATLQTTYTQGQVLINAGMYYMVIQNSPINTPITDDVYFSRLTGTTDVVTAYLPRTDANGNVLSPYKFIQIFRQFKTDEYEMIYEYSVHDIARNGYTSNDMVIEQGHSTDFLNKNRQQPAVDGGLGITVNRPFRADERLILDYIQGFPIQVTTWTTQNSAAPDMAIPDFLSEVVKLGMIYRLANLAYNKGDDRYLRVADRNKVLYDQALQKAMSYARKFKNKTGFKQLKPYEVLPDGNKNLYEL